MLEDHRGVPNRACVASCGEKRCAEDVTAEAGKALCGSRAEAG